MVDSGRSCVLRSFITPCSLQSTAVESAQTVLIQCGYNRGCRSFFGKEHSDGDFGPAIEKVIRNFQTRTALEPDGEIGAETWAVLITE